MGPPTLSTSIVNQRLGAPLGGSLHHTSESVNRSPGVVLVRGGTQDRSERGFESKLATPRTKRSGRVATSARCEGHKTMPLPCHCQPTATTVAPGRSAPSAPSLQG